MKSVNTSISRKTAAKRATNLEDSKRNVRRSKWDRQARPEQVSADLVHAAHNQLDSLFPGRDTLLMNAVVANAHA
jgi:DNA phosphorothioation-dependent restriction protein DptG